MTSGTSNGNILIDFWTLGSDDLFVCFDRFQSSMDTQLVSCRKLLGPFYCFNKRKVFQNLSLYSSHCQNLFRNKWSNNCLVVFDKLIIVTDQGLLKLKINTSTKQILIFLLFVCHAELQLTNYTARLIENIMIRRQTDQMR